MSGDLESLRREVAAINRRLRAVEEFVVEQRPIVNGSRTHSARDEQYARDYGAVLAAALDPDHGLRPEAPSSISDETGAGNFFQGRPT